MLGEERRRLLLELIQQQRSLTIAEAERRLAVSRMTVHRDLEQLAAENLVRKVHGGAIAVDRAVFDPRASAFNERLVTHAEAKRAIARQAARLIEGARTLLVDASSTAFFLAETLLSPDETFVIAGGLPLAAELQRRYPKMRVALHGGEAIRTGALVGPLALASLEEVRVDWAIVSCLGVVEDEGALYDSHPEEVEVKRAYLERARRRLLAIDSSKLGLSGAYKFTDLSAFDVVVTEGGVRRHARRRK